MEKLKVLAVDDEAGVLNIIKNVLGDDYAITTETSASEAVKLIQQERFGIFLIDYQLNDEITGIDLLKLIRKKQKKSTSIFFTALGTEYLFKEEKDLYDFLIGKPFEIDDFKLTFYKAIAKLEKTRI
ncbi:MAG: response regulator [Spirochaetales bacterium]|nr:response regulator [Spirochaetales bacterium]